MDEVRHQRSGRAARQAERSRKGGGVGRPYILRNIPTYDILGEENLSEDRGGGGSDPGRDGDRVSR